MAFDAPHKIFITFFGIILLISGWSPWLSSEKAREIVRTYPSFEQQHSSRPIASADICVLPTPFCRLINTYEGLWWVCFWQKVPPPTIAQAIEQPSLPHGYTLESYRIEKITSTSCQHFSECETPPVYHMLSSCPYTSLCLQNTCTVVCPDFASVQ